MRTSNTRDWRPCPSGEWHKLAQLLRYYRRAALAMNALVVVLAAMVVSLSGWAVASVIPEFQSNILQSGTGNYAVPPSAPAAPCHPVAPPAVPNAGPGNGPM